MDFAAERGSRGRSPCPAPAKGPRSPGPSSGRLPEGRAGPGAGAGRARGGLAAAERRSPASQRRAVAWRCGSWRWRWPRCWRGLRPRVSAAGRAERQPAREAGIEPGREALRHGSPPRVGSGRAALSLSQARSSPGAQRCLRSFPRSPSQPSPPLGPTLPKCSGDSPRDPPRSRPRGGGARFPFPP
jgi:hypothetical protein